MKLLTTVDGRDKLYKTIQYGARALWWFIFCKDPKNSVLPKLASLDSATSDARRVFRLGGFFREFQNLLICKPGVSTMHTFKTVSTLSSFLGEVLDVIIWVAKLRVVNLNRDRWDWWRNLLWMVTVWYTLIENYLLVSQLWQAYLRLVCILSKSHSSSPHTWVSVKTHHSSSSHFPLLLFHLSSSSYYRIFILHTLRISIYYKPPSPDPKNRKMCSLLLPLSSSLPFF